MYVNIMADNVSHFLLVMMLVKLISAVAVTLNAARGLQISHLNRIILQFGISNGILYCCVVACCFL